jgi:hypothetical protein
MMKLHNRIKLMALIAMTSCSFSAWADDNKAPATKTTSPQLSVQEKINSLKLLLERPEKLFASG